MVPARLKRLGERVPYGACRLAAHPLDEPGAALDEERVAHLVEDADRFQDPDAGRQERLAQMKARVARALEDDHSSPVRSETCGAHGPRGAAADDGRVEVGHSAVFGGGPS